MRIMLYSLACSISYTALSRHGVVSEKGFFSISFG